MKTDQINNLIEKYENAKKKQKTNGDGKDLQWIKNKTSEGNKDSQQVEKK